MNAWILFTIFIIAPQLFEMFVFDGFFQYLKKFAAL